MAKPGLKPSDVLPTSQQSWGGYWTFVTAVIMIMFVIFVAGNGLLKSWLGLLVYSDPKVPDVSTPAQAASSQVAGQIGSILPAANAAAAAAGLPAGTGTQAAAAIGTVGAAVINPNIGLGLFQTFLGGLTGGVYGGKK